MICSRAPGCRGVMGALGIATPRRSVNAEHGPGGQLVGAPQPAAESRSEAAPVPNAATGVPSYRDAASTVTTVPTGVLS